MTTNEMVDLIKLHHPEACEIDPETLELTIRFTDRSDPLRFIPEE